MEVQFSNVDEAFKGMVSRFQYPEIYNAPIKRVPSRAGEVLMIEEPVTVTYNHPRRRVLFNEARDANPFFHLFEALWMLAGKNDVDTLAYYSSGIADIASDDGKTFNGAYGYRWRNKVDVHPHMRHEGEYFDQLPVIIDQLKRKPESRRCVLQMWNVDDDLRKIDKTKDVCCNTAAYFSLRDTVEGMLLDMTVTNRSNDLVWGMLGANVVHFSILQEYMAAHIGVRVGKYRQFTNNLHVYTERFKPLEWLSCNVPDWYSCDPPLFPLVRDPKQFDDELYVFVEHALGDKVGIESLIFYEPFFASVALPMALQYRYYKAKEWEKALHMSSLIKAWDWGTASTNWVWRRHQRWLSQNPYNPQGVEE